MLPMKAARYVLGFAKPSMIPVQTSFLSMLPLNFAFKSACDAHRDCFSGTPRCFKSDKSHELTVNELIAAAEIQVCAHYLYSVIKPCFIRHIFICSNSTLNKWHHVRGGALKLELTETGFCCCYEFHFRDSHISARVKPPFRPSAGSFTWNFLILLMINRHHPSPRDTKMLHYFLCAALLCSVVSMVTLILQNLLQD